MFLTNTANGLKPDWQRLHKISKSISVDTFEYISLCDIGIWLFASRSAHTCFGFRMVSGSDCLFMVYPRTYNYDLKMKNEEKTRNE